MSGRLIPNPGSPEAKEQGCKCPRLDNRGGLGINYTPSTPPEELRFWISAACPLHAPKADDAEQRP